MTAYKRNRLLVSAFSILGIGACLLLARADMGGTLVYMLPVPLSLLCFGALILALFNYDEDDSALNPMNRQLHKAQVDGFSRVNSRK